MNDERKVYALLSPQGTACAETALCETHFEPEFRDPIDASAEKRKGEHDAAIPGSWVDCSGNPELECAECGYYRLDAREGGGTTQLTELARARLIQWMEELGPEDDGGYSEAPLNERMRFLNTAVDALREALVSADQNFWANEFVPFDVWMEANASE